MNSTGFTIRQADMRDAEPLARFNQAMARETEGRELDPEVALVGVKALLKDPRKGFYLLAEARQETHPVIGQLMVTFEWSDWRAKSFWWVQSVFVVPEWRGRRVFSALFRRVQEMARWHKEVAGLRLYVIRHNQHAQTVYETLGMVKTAYDLFEMEF
jgi:GNAT superfamily N-acetyltransferase